MLVLKLSEITLNINIFQLHGQLLASVQLNSLGSNSASLVAVITTPFLYTFDSSRLCTCNTPIKHSTIGSVGVSSKGSLTPLWRNITQPEIHYASQTQLVSLDSNLNLQINYRRWPKMLLTFR